MKILKGLLTAVLILGMSAGFTTTAYANKETTQTFFYGDIEQEGQSEVMVSSDELSEEDQVELIATIEKYCDTKDIESYQIQINNLKKHYYIGMGAIVVGGGSTFRTLLPWSSFSRKTLLKINLVGLFVGVGGMIISFGSVIAIDSNKKKIEELKNELEKFCKL